jgi:hypothetical protein
MRFIVEKPPIHIAGNCVGLLAQIWGGGLERKRKVGRKEKNELATGHVFPLPSPLNMNEIRQTVWNFHGAKN